MTFESFRRFLRRGTETQAPEFPEPAQPTITITDEAIERHMKVLSDKLEGGSRLTHFITYDPKGPVAQADRVRVWDDPDREPSTSYVDEGPPYDTGLIVWAHHPKSRDLDKSAVVETTEAYHEFHKQNLDRVQSIQFSHGLHRAEMLFRAMEPTHEGIDVYFSTAKVIQKEETRRAEITEAIVNQRYGLSR